MKKTKTKTKSPTPATPTKPARNKTSAAAKQEPAPTPVVPQPKPAVPAAPASAINAVTSAPVKTRIVAQLDVGFGNALYVRGDGPGLSWNQGVPMECLANDQWELVLGEASRPISFKVLMNDTIWCTGPDSVVASGSTARISPEFP